MIPRKKWPVSYLALPLVALLGALLACARLNNNPSAPWSVSSQNNLPKTAIARLTSTPPPPVMPALPTPGGPILSPTPDSPHPLPTLRTGVEEYVVQASDTLNQIARRYQISLDALVQANNLPNPDYLEVGQVLTIPEPEPGAPGPGYKIIPDSELVYGPASVGFDLEGFVRAKGGYLASYTEDVEGTTLTGVQIIQRLAQNYSVNPRLLLAVLEYQSHWVTQSNPDPETLDYPIQRLEAWRKGLYRQLAWAANNLNRGYYLWRAGGVGYWIMADGQIVPVDPTINAGTAGVQNLFSLMDNRPEWEKAVTENGFVATYQAFFGYPFQLAYEPLVPPGILQPPMQLPFEKGPDWAFTGGPHGSWDDGSAWGALDFAPFGEPLGCVQSDSWVVAVADGKIVRAGEGAVILDLDSSGPNSADGFEQTGWVMLYMHIETRGRIEAGVTVRAGDRIGHPSCEGGVSSGTHVHLARRYNGEWIPADQTLPFVLDGWVSRGTGKEYDGFLQKDDQSVEAWEGNLPENMIHR